MVYNTGAQANNKDKRVPSQGKKKKEENTGHKQRIYRETTARNYDFSSILTF